MITAVDTNVLVGFLLPDHAFNQRAAAALEAAARAGSLVIAPLVYVELLAIPGKTRLWMDDFLQDVGIAVEWELEEATWLEAGEAFAAYARRRRKSGETSRRIVADFVIGAHALRQADRLLTADDWYKTIYKGLRLEVVRVKRARAPSASEPLHTLHGWTSRRVNPILTKTNPKLGGAAMLTSRRTHPLDPLSAEEILAATGLVKQKKKLSDQVRFPVVTLKEPTPAQLGAKGPPDRVALVVVLDRGSGETHEALVNLTRAKVGGWKKVAAGQPPIIIEEFFAVVEIVKNDPAWRAAALRRGLSEADLELVQVDPFSAGHFGFKDEEGRRMVRAVAYYRQDPKDNAYAHPLEGLVAYVDLNRREVFKLVEEGAIPVPRRKGNYLPQFLQAFRDDLKALEITQPQGPSFRVEGYKVEWQRWSFRVGFTPREGLVLHQVGYTDGGRLRPILHRASVSEMVVPYADPGVNHFWKNAFDAGEYGLGKLANSLELGCDCLGHIHYFDAVVADDLGAPTVIPNAVCLHEEDYGTLWKHYEFRNETFETRRSRRLVVSFWSTVGNYDYGFFWYFYQDGTMQFEVKLSGIIQTAALVPGQGYRFGGMVTPELGGPTHQHFFNVRLHMNLDGGPNSVQEVEMVRARKGRTDPYGNTFRYRVKTLKTEGEAARVGDNLKGRFWKVICPSRRNAVGEPTAYKLVGSTGPTLLADPKSAIYKRGAFATRHLWVTPFDPEQLYAAGDYPNQSPGDDGLGVWTKADRPIENKDLVVWYNLGVTHICRPEDWPIMPVEHLSFSLKPVGFFDQNPALDVPLPKGAHGGKGESCHP